MSGDRIRQVLLELLVDDSFALSEIVSRVRQEMPALSAREAVRVSRKGVEELLKLGLVEVSQLENPRDSEVPIHPIEALAALKDDLSWVTSMHWRPHLRVAATAAGKDAYFGAK